MKRMLARLWFGLIYGVYTALILGGLYCTIQAYGWKAPLIPVAIFVIVWVVFSIHDWAKENLE